MVETLITMSGGVVIKHKLQSQVSSLFSFYTLEILLSEKIITFHGLLVSLFTDLWIFTCHWRKGWKICKTHWQINSYLMAVPPVVVSLEICFKSPNCLAEGRESWKVSSSPSSLSCSLLHLHQSRDDILFQKTPRTSPWSLARCNIFKENLLDSGFEAVLRYAFIIYQEV